MVLRMYRHVVACEMALPQKALPQGAFNALALMLPERTSATSPRTSSGSRGFGTDSRAGVAGYGGARDN